jgi:predicted PurR-regulated permease PerM
MFQLCVQQDTVASSTFWVIIILILLALGTIAYTFGNNIDKMRQELNSLKHNTKTRLNNIENNIDSSSTNIDAIHKVLDTLTSKPKSKIDDNSGDDSE